MTSAPVGTDTVLTYRANSSKLLFLGLLVVGFGVLLFVVPASVWERSFIALIVCVLLVMTLITSFGKITVAPGVVTIRSLSAPHQFVRGSTKLATMRRRTKAGMYTLLYLTDTRDGTRRKVEVSALPEYRRTEFLVNVGAALDQRIPELKFRSKWGAWKQEALYVSANPSE